MTESNGAVLRFPTATWVTGEGPPDASTGNFGDLHLDTLNHEFRGPKSDASDPWGAPVSMVGPQGIQGPAGLDLEFVWDGTRLGVRKQGETTYAYVDLLGPIGPQGVQGERGARISAGEGAPTFAATEGDLYIDTSIGSGDLYEYAGGAWTLTGNVRGPIGPIGETGRGFTPRGEWDATLSYAVDDIATYLGAVYRRTVAGTTTAAPPNDVTNWELWAAKGEVGDPGAGVPDGGAQGDYIVRTATASTVWEDPATRFPAGDPSAALDGQVWAYDSGAGRWAPRTVSEGGAVTPTMHGGVYGEADSTLAVQAMIDEVRGSYDNSLGGYRLYADLEGRMWRVTSIDATMARPPSMTVTNGGLHGMGAGRVTFDMSGSNGMIVENFEVDGDEASPPAVGILCGRYTDASGGFPVAPHHKFAKVMTDGHFSKAAFVNFASEVSGMSLCSIHNKHRSVNAYCLVIASHAGTFDDYLGGLFSEYVTTPTAADGAHSCILHELGQVRALRNADVNLRILDITNASPPTVTVDAQDLRDSGLALDDQVFFSRVEGMTEINHQSFAIAQVDAVNGTFVLKGVDSISYGTFSGGRLQNRTGPAILLSGCSGVHLRSAYLLTYGCEPVVWDMKNGGACLDNTLEYQAEAHPPFAMCFDLPDTGAGYQANLVVRLLNASQDNRDGVILPRGGASTNSLRIDNLKLSVANMGATPASGIFAFKAKLDLRGAEIRTPKAESMSAMANYASFSGVVYAADTDSHDYYGSHVFH